MELLHPLPLLPLLPSPSSTPSHVSSELCNSLDTSDPLCLPPPVSSTQPPGEYCEGGGCIVCRLHRALASSARGSSGPGPCPPVRAASCGPPHTLCAAAMLKCFHFFQRARLFSHLRTSTHAITCPTSASPPGLILGVSVQWHITVPPSTRLACRALGSPPLLSPSQHSCTWCLIISFPLQNVLKLFTRVYCRYVLNGAQDRSRVSSRCGRLPGGSSA